MADVLSMHAGVLFISGMFSSMPSNTLAKLSATALMWHAVVIISMTLLVPMIAPYYQSASFVWTEFRDTTHSDSGITSNLYLFMQVAPALPPTFAGEEQAVDWRAACTGCPGPVPVAHTPVCFAGPFVWQLVLHR